MTYEIIEKIENNCKRNQMRDVFFEEREIENPDVWIREREPGADSYERENIKNGIRYCVTASGLLKVYELTEAD